MTANSLDQTRAWFDAGAEGDSLAASPADSLRCHVSLLGLLPPEHRRDFITAAEKQLQVVVQELKTRVANSSGTDQFVRLAEQGSLDVARTRLHWLRKVFAAL